MKKLMFILMLTIVTFPPAYGRTPPQESQDACEGMTEGSSCSFTGPRGAETGTCTNTPDNTYFACRPERGGRGRGRGGRGEGAEGKGTGTRMGNREGANGEASVRANGSAGGRASGEQANRRGSGEGRVPPQESLDACKSKNKGTSCSFVSPRGDESGTCVSTPDNRYFACRPDKGKAQGTNSGSGPQSSQRRRNPRQKYSIEQATSDNAQQRTIEFAALSFMSSGLCEMSFLPPGKHASYFGFQNMRDVIGGAAGHSQNFVPQAANTLLYILSDQQKSVLINLAKQQQAKIESFALARFPLLATFDRYANGELPKGKTQLNRKEIVRHSGDLYAIDGELSYERAVGFGKIVRSLTQNQKAYLNRFKSQPFQSWPKRRDQINKRQYEHSTHVAIMTYASELLSWYIGDVKKDTYFTPERTAAYFGAYWTKAAPMKAVKRDNYQISTKLTADSGAKFSQFLTTQQKRRITDLVSTQKSFLRKMVTVRGQIANEIRKIFYEEKADLARIVRLSRTFGELDGEIAYLYATAFTNVKKGLSSTQLKKAVQLRNISQYTCKEAFIYAEPSPVPNFGDITGFFQ